MRPEWKDRVWTFNIVQVRLHAGRVVRLLTVMDEYTRECLANRVDRSIRSADVIEALAELMMIRGVPDHIRSDNGPESTAMRCVSGFGEWGRGHCTSKPGHRAGHPRTTRLAKHPESLSTVSGICYIEAVTKGQAGMSQSYHSYMCREQFEW